MKKNYLQLKFEDLSMLPSPSDSSNPLGEALYKRSQFISQLLSGYLICSCLISNSVYINISKNHVLIVIS